MKMRHKYLIIVMMAVSFGCVTAGYNKADYIRNLNMIDFGKYRVVLDKSFVPIGNLNGDIMLDSMDGAAPLEITRYLFADISKGKDNVTRAICIQQHRLTDGRFQFLQIASFDGYKLRHIEKGRVKLDGIDVAYLIHSSPNVAKDVLELGRSKGFQMGKMDYGIAIKFAIDVSEQRYIIIEYVEGGSINYENNYSEVRKAFDRADRYITLMK